MFTAYLRHIDFAVGEKSVVAQGADELSGAFPGRLDPGPESNLK